MIEDLLFVLDDVGEHGARYAASLAKYFDAHLTALCITGKGSVDAFALSELRYDLILAARERTAQRAAATAQRFVTDAKLAGVDVDSSSYEDLPATKHHLVARARLSDLVVIEQAEPGRPKPTDPFIETLLLRTGRPALLVPYGHTRAAAFDHVTVAWDESAVSARALADSIPFLQRASSVDVVCVETEGLPLDHARDERIVRHLARHGIDARARTISSTLSVAETILSNLADSDADLLVMGAYSHSPLREVMIGGTTRSILRTMTAPVLLSH